MDCETDLRASRTYHLTAVHGVRNYSPQSRAPEESRADGPAFLCSR